MFFPKRIFQLEFSLTQKFNTVVLSLERLYRYLTLKLRQKIEEKLGVRTDDTESYIAYNHVDDENEVEDPHFSIIWTSNKLIARISDDMTQDVATYRYVCLYCVSQVSSQIML